MRRQEDTPVKNPTFKEQFILRVMILFGVITMYFFLSIFFDKKIIGYAPLYWLLIISFIFTCLKLLHEWYHYFFIVVPPTPVTEKQFTVDIFTTFCAGEPYEMVVETLTAIQQITYPHETYLCDEANDPYLMEVCKKLGVHHVTRTHKINAKAGNINNALKNAKGELCVILDPDHVPFPNFLDPIVSHFNNPEIGYVQIVQAYKNESDGLIAKGAAQQTYQFYGPMMMTMNKYGTVLAIGANCTFRRKALDSIGGHAAGLAEDMNTAMRLHAEGWKSVYVPQILALGLVPSTLSAYYKQQLKWARGVFELLVTTYKEKFWKFTLLQKIHYGTIPVYYLSGLIYLINFLIPIIALTTAYVPVKLGLQTFTLIGTPFLLLIVFIRHYVQKWVTKEEERGFHVVGGLLAIGTWWIFIIGLYYTIIRKKVPYDPTPKDDNEANNWPLNIPNIAVLMISLCSIVYGLYTDWNPYMWFMAGLAVLNCMILLFNIVASRQHEFRKYKEKNQLVKSSMDMVTQTKKSFWLFRRRVYSWFRSYPVLILVFSLCVGTYIEYSQNKSLNAAPEEKEKESLLIPGIFAPETDNGLTSLSFIHKLSVGDKNPFSLISFYIPWGDAPQSAVPVPLIDSIYLSGGIPLITWEPWSNLFNDAKNINPESGGEHMLSKIASGAYDTYILKFANDLKALQKPVFLRFGHEADNPFYPWSPSGKNTPEDFKKAWKYLHALFTRAQVSNVIWVWNPWKPEAMARYFPGKEYVDWIGINILDYAHHNINQQSFSFESLYSPFHQSPLFKSGLPVMISEMGTLRNSAERNLWFQNAFASMKSWFPEIKAYVVFNSSVDKNTVTPGNSNPLNWKLPEATLLNFAKTEKNNFNPFVIDPPAKKPLPYPGVENLKQLKGINYTRTLNWASNYNPVMKRYMVVDFKEIKDMGISTIKFFESGIYNHNLFAAAAATGLSVYYSFGIPESINFIKDSGASKSLAQRILSVVRKRKNNSSIVAWSFGNDYYLKIAQQYHQPQLFYQRQAYIRWLNDLIHKIKEEDPGKPVSIDLGVDEDLVYNTRLIYRGIRDLDKIGLICGEKSQGLNQINELDIPYYFSNIEPALYLQPGFSKTNRTVFIADWQDQQQWQYITFNGVKDWEGKSKNTLFQILKLWGNSKTKPLLPPVKILRPAVAIFEQDHLLYNVLLYQNNQWVFATQNPMGLQFLWYLVRMDKYGNAIAASKIGEGPAVYATMPKNPKFYKIYVRAVKNNQVATAYTTLNTPLYQE